MIKTSIIVPVYNAADYLKDCFNSIFNQTQKEIEVIAINDGSTDESLHILEEIRIDHPNMIIFSQLNQGPGSARNKGIELATGEYIYFMDSDDCLVSDALETCYQYAKNNHLDIVMFDAKTIGDTSYEKASYYNRADIIADQRNVMRGEDFAINYWLKTFCPSPCLLYISKCFFITYNLNFIPQIYYEDIEFYCKTIPLAGRIMYIPQMLYIRRYREKSITTSAFDLNHANSYLQMIQAISKQQQNNKMKAVIHRIQLNSLNALLLYCQKNDLLKDFQFCQEFYKLALEICGGSIDKIIMYNDIETLYQISIFMPDEVISIKVKKKIKNRKKEILEKMFVDLPLKLEGRYVGIYGTGKNTERFINEYEEYIAKIKANVIFIDSNVMSGEKKYKNYPIYNINDIEKTPLECIVIASSKYEHEMCQSISEKYGNKFKIVRLCADLHF